MIKKVRIFITDKGEEREIGGHGCFTQQMADEYEAMLKKYSPNGAWRITVEDYVE